MSIHNMAELPTFMQKQYEFAERIRNPEHAARPADVPQKRMAVYEELFFNNINEALSNAFPVLRTIHDEESWLKLVRDYFATHCAHTPLFHEMPREFLSYLLEERESHDDFPFISELAHYEWIELELMTAEESESDFNAEGNLLTETPVLSPLIRRLGYNYAVHKISPDYLPTEAEKIDTHLLVYRDSHDKIGFIELNPVTNRLLHLIEQNSSQSGEELLRQIAEELQHPNPQTVIEGGMAILADLKQRGVLLGSR